MGKKIVPENKFVVMSKGNRTLILTNPKDKQIKRYNKRKWVVLGGESGTEEILSADQLQSAVASAHPAIAAAIGTI